MKIDTKTARAKLQVRGKPYWMPLSGGISLGYRRVLSGAGTWSVRIADGKGGGPTKRLAAADDLAAPDGKNILDFAQARDAALKFAHGGDKATPVALVTLGEAIEAYRVGLAKRNRDEGNARRLRGNLPPAMLQRPIALLDAKELLAWRDSMAERLEPSGVNRLMICFKATLNLAAKYTEGLNPKTWRDGLEALRNTKVAHNNVLHADTVIALVQAARARSVEFGLIVEVLAQTGARFSQIARCEVRHLRDSRLMVPSSFKGNDKKEAVLTPVPLPADLIARLRLAAGDRPATARLLQQPGGGRWERVDNRFDTIVKDIGEDPAVLTTYALRHTHITAQLLAGLPVQLVAKLHDTSVSQIEGHYAAEIASQADDLVRGTMLAIDRPQANVVPLRQVSA